jgi:hypothetical protein
VVGSTQKVNMPPTAHMTDVIANVTLKSVTSS